MRIFSSLVLASNVISPGQAWSRCKLWYLQKSMNIKAYYFKGLFRAVTLLTSLSGLTFNTCAL